MGELWRTMSDRLRPLEELYDLASDPHETRNLAASPDHARAKKRLRAALYKWMYDTADFLRGADQDEQIMDWRREMRWVGK